MKSDFIESFSQVVRNSGRWRNYAPADLVAQWTELVAKCVIGFPGNAEDYFNDLTARSDLEGAMSSPELADYPEMLAVVKSVSVADAEFRKILKPDAFPKFPENQWWNRGIVRFAGPRLVDELKQFYGVEIDVVSEGEA
ncbi:hypothetical protein [Actinoplanes solisilvae]|uniref:hypothetical protein n=1 Tax=Actinoplanes solisilvae TaxID=2486853 RepID=UPI001F0C7A85|nr:hypothetical protein [Actinoplanes solisilvae]